jgi:hypothetical protein
VLTVHCSCVQTAVSALNVLCPVCATRKGREDALTTAALPTADSGELPSMFSVIVLLTMDALIVGRPGNPLGDPDPDPEGDAGLPPHPVTAAAMTASDAVWREWAQNSRRLYLGIGMSCSGGKRHAAKAAKLLNRSL